MILSDLILRWAYRECGRSGGASEPSRSAKPAITASNICGVSVPVFVFSREQ